jgi:hypothetical protein
VGRGKEEPDGGRPVADLPLPRLVVYSRTVKRTRVTDEGLAVLPLVATPHDLIAGKVQQCARVTAAAVRRVNSNRLPVENHDPIHELSIAALRWHMWRDTSHS